MVNPLEEISADARAFKKACKSDSRHRSICKRFYVNAQEERQIQQICQGLNQSRYFRSRILETQIPRPRAAIPQVNRDTYIQLTSIRSNINQIARAVNTAAKQGRELPLTQSYPEQLEKLEKLLVAIGLQLNYGEDTDREEN